MSVTAAESKGITVIVCVAGSSDSDMPLTVMPVFPVDPVFVVVPTDVGVVGEEESPPPQPASIPTTNSTTINLTRHLRIFSTEQDTE